MMPIKFLMFIVILVNFLCVKAQQKKQADLKLVFYNVENFFDCIDDPLTSDEEFLPEGSRRWTPYRFSEKANNIYKVFTAIGEFSFPDIIGMCEVENASVLDYLLKKTPMRSIPLAYVHQESADPRGIDACILYRTDKLKLLNSEFIKIIQKNGSVLQTRDIVYASLQTKKKDILHVFVNHWPSRRGGELETQQKRNIVATILRNKIDSVLKTDPSANIIIAGDFNDNPYNQSITKYLKSQSSHSKVNHGGLYNLSEQFAKTYGTGTLKFRGRWSVFDQILVSGSLLDNKGIFTCVSCAGIFNQPFLLVDDKSNMGKMPFRTYNGFKYTGGFSDHLPVYLNLYF